MRVKLTFDVEVNEEAVARLNEKLGKKPYCSAEHMLRNEAMSQWESEGLVVMPTEVMDEDTVITALLEALEPLAAFFDTLTESDLQAE